MNLMEPYSHLAVEWVDDLTGSRECRRCPRPLTGWADTLRHADEAFRPDSVDPAHADAVHDYVTLGARALADMWTDNCSDVDRARAVVEELYRGGCLKVARPRRKTRVS